MTRGPLAVRVMACRGCLLVWREASDVPRLAGDVVRAQYGRCPRCGMDGAEQVGRGEAA